MSLDYWRDASQRFYLSYSEDRLYYLHTEDDKYIATLAKDDLTKLYKSIGEIILP